MKNIVVYRVLEKVGIKMRKNLSVDIAKLFNLDIGEPFEIEGYNGVEFYFNANGLFGDTGKGVILAKEPLAKIILGEAKIKRGPFVPKLGDVFWTFCESYYKPGCWEVCKDTWGDTFLDHLRLKSEWVFRTKKEALDALPEVAKEQGVKYKIGEEDA